MAVKEFFASIIARFVAWNYLKVDEVYPFGTCPACGGRHIGNNDDVGRSIISCAEFKTLVEYLE